MPHEAFRAPYSYQRRHSAVNHRPHCTWPCADLYETGFHLVEEDGHERMRRRWMRAAWRSRCSGSRCCWRRPIPAIITHSEQIFCTLSLFSSMFTRNCLKNNNNNNEKLSGLLEIDSSVMSSELDANCRAGRTSHHSRLTRSKNASFSEFLTLLGDLYRYNNKIRTHLIPCRVLLHVCAILTTK